MSPRQHHTRQRHTPPASRDWDPVADWYVGWVGAHGSEHHRRLAIPALLELLRPSPGECMLDVGCGPGVLAGPIAEAGAHYTGVDASRKLLAFARRHHSAACRFVLGDATRLAACSELTAGTFDAAVFLLSIQDIEPLEGAIASAAWAVRPEGRVVLLMTHPCFRVPRQSGWGWDPNRRLQYRRVDRYLTRLAVPMKVYSGRRGATRSYHRPLAAYVNALARQGLFVDQLREIPAAEARGDRRHGGAVQAAHREIPLFLGIRAVRKTA